MKKLKDIAQVKTGLVLARKTAQISEETKKAYQQLNLKCIQDETTIDPEALEPFNSIEELNQRYLTQPRDVVVRLTAPFTAVLITPATAGLVITSNFCTVRVNTKTVLPEYIHWYLNRQEIKNKIEKNKSGSTYSAVKPGFFAQLEIPLLPLEEQKKLVAFYKTANRELKLLSALKEQKEYYYTETLEQYFKRRKKRGNT